MKLEGGCYCGKVRYVAEGEPTMKAQCHCRECQYISGFGGPQMAIHTIDRQAFRQIPDGLPTFERLPSTWRFW